MDFRRGGRWRYGWSSLLKSIQSILAEKSDAGRTDLKTDPPSFASVVKGFALPRPLSQDEELVRQPVRLRIRDKGVSERIRRLRSWVVVRNNGVLAGDEACFDFRNWMAKWWGWENLREIKRLGDDSWLIDCGSVQQGSSSLATDRIEEVAKKVLLRHLESVPKTQDMELRRLKWGFNEQESGLGDISKQFRVRCRLKDMKANIWCFQETKLREVDSVVVCSLLGRRDLEWEACGAVGSRGDDFRWMLCNVYGLVYAEDKKAFLQELRDVLGWWRFPFCLVGDFNMVRSLEEVSGGHRSLTEMNNFNAFIDEFGIIDLPLNGAVFTHSNFQDRATLSRLDRFSEEWLEFPEYREAVRAFWDCDGEGSNGLFRWNFISSLSIDGVVFDDEVSLANAIVQFYAVVNNARVHLETWKARLLSIGGRITMLKSVLSQMSIYHLSLFKAPASVIKDLERIQNKFLWEGTGEVRKPHLVRWDTVKTPISRGGLEVLDLKLLNMALLSK
ncbi:Putative ribonuclease H protein At1g65750 [Linum perenne]